MFRPLAFASVLVFSTRCFSQQVTAEPSVVPGIEIIGPQDSGFTRAVAQVAGSDQPASLTAWLPYSFLVRNNSSQPFAAICVAWSAKLNGDPQTHNLADACPSWFDRRSHQVQPGQVVLFTPAGIVSSPRNLNIFSQGRGLGNLPNYKRAQSVGIFRGKRGFCLRT